MTEREVITRAYDEGAQREYARLVQSPLHEAEWSLVIDLIDEYIACESVVVDIGAGPGRYAEYLLKQRNCQVGLVDLSEECLALFTSRIGASHQERVKFTWKSCATDLSWIPEGTFDTVLLMGPLYHLVTEQERKKAIAEALRILVPGGFVFATFISCYPVFSRILTHDPSLLHDEKFLDNLLNQGMVFAKDGISSMTDHFRCWPQQARLMMETSGFETLRMRNLEGVGSFFQAKHEKVLTTGRDKNAWFDILRKTCELPDLLGATLHFIYVGRKN